MGRALCTICLRFNVSVVVLIVIRTGWSNLPVKRGMVYCFHRSCQLYFAPIRAIVESISSYAVISSSMTYENFLKSPQGTIDSSVVNVGHTQLTSNLALARSSRFSPNGSYMVFLGSTAPQETHGGCSELFSIKWNNDIPDLGSLAVLVPIVDTPRPEVLCGFPGLFTGNLPASCFVSDNIIILETSWRFFSCVLLVDIFTGNLGAIHSTSGAVFEMPRESSRKVGIQEHLSQSPHLYSSSILDVQLISNDNIKSSSVLLLISAPNDPGRLVHLNILGSESLKSDYSEWNITTQVSDTLPPMAITSKLSLDGETKLYKKLSTKLLTIPVPDTLEFIDVLMLLPEIQAVEAKLPPLVVVPHGGPHSTFSTAFLAPYTYLCLSLRAVVAMVNYRGSTV